MTSRGRKALSVTQGDSSPKGRAKASYIGTRNGAYLYRYASIHCFTATLNARAARKSDGRKRFPSRHPCLSLWERWPSAARTERATTATSNRKMLAPSQADDVPRAQVVTQGDSSPKGRAKASYIGTRNGAYLYRYAPFTVLRLPLNARAARKSDGRKTVSVPAPLASPCGRGGRAQRGRRGQITATSNRKMLAPSQADDVPRAQGSSQSPVVTALPKGEPRHRILAQEMERICIDTLHSLVLRLPSMRVPPESRMVVNGFRPGILLPLPVGEVAERSEDGEGK